MASRQIGANDNNQHPVSRVPPKTHYQQTSTKRSLQPHAYQGLHTRAQPSHAHWHPVRSQSHHYRFETGLRADPLNLFPKAALFLRTGANPKPSTTPKAVLPMSRQSVFWPQRGQRVVYIHVQPHLRENRLTTSNELCGHSPP
eukprot:3302333-Amphidinium_carterae.1